MLDGLLTVAFGVFAVLIGYGKVNIGKNPTANAQYIGKYRNLFRIAGIVMIVCGLVIILSKFV